MLFSKKIKIKQKKSSSKKKKKENKKRGILQTEGKLAVDVYETKTDFIVMAATGGVSREDIDISVEKDMLLIKGDRENPVDTEDKNYFYKECYWGPFSRKIIVPQNVNTSQIDASMENGILKIKMPKLQKDEKKEIDLK